MLPNVAWPAAVPSSPTNYLGMGEHVQVWTRTKGQAALIILANLEESTLPRFASNVHGATRIATSKGQNHSLLHAPTSCPLSQLYCSLCEPETFLVRP